MSCEIKLKSNINELARIKRILFPDEQEDEDDGWSGTDAWSWKSDFEETSPSSKLSDNWLQHCLISCTPQSEIMVIAYQNRYVVLASKWEKNDQEKEVQKYHLVYPTSTNSFIGEEISALLCLPITSFQKTSQGMPDWICIVLGYTSGMVRMYTVDGSLLMTEAFHGEPVHQIKFHTSVKNHALQELTVLYEKVFIVVEGLGLFNSLKACRSCLAKGRAMFGSGDASMEHPPLHYRKFGLQEQNRINTCFLLGTAAPTTFDHLVTASVAGGFHARYNNVPPIATGILSLGSQPYCAWHYAVEGSAAPLLSDVAYALASRVTSKILSKTSGWLGWGSSGASKPENAPSRAKEKQMMEPATSIYPRYGLADALREALSVSVSPNKKLAAVTDSLGRVVLIDLQRGIAVRMWKGYRDAQCGWVSSWESNQQSTLVHDASPRTVSFLVIYISKRGIIEVWTPQQGSRIAAFNCVKGARLLSLGTGFTSDKDIAQCCLLGPDGRIDEICVPFHCALKGDSSQRARDLHLLQQFRTQISHEIGKNSFELLLEMRHASVVSQALDALLASERLLEADALITCLDSLVSHYSESKALDAESRLLLTRCQFIASLARVFVFVENEQRAPPDYETTQETSPALIEDVVKTLQLNQEEIARILNLPEQQETSQQASAISSLKLFNFLHAFDINTSHVESDREGRVKLKSSLKESDREQISCWFWGALFFRGASVVGKFLVALKESQIMPEDLASLLIHYWLDYCSPGFDAILHLHSLLHKICKLAAPEKLIGTDFLSPWWQKISDILANTKKLKLGCCATLVVRSIISKLDKEKVNEVRQSKMEEEDVRMDDSLSEWEDMSVDMMHWSALTKQLEDLSHVSQLLHYVPVHLLHNRIHELEFSFRDSQESLEFTLASVLRKGRGSVTELIARWIVQNLLEPSLLFSQSSCSEDLSESSEADSNRSIDQAPEADKLSIGSSEDAIATRELFQNVAKHLPHSTEHDVILISTAVEYAALWLKNPKCTKVLEIGLNTLSAIKSNLLRHGVSKTLWSMCFAPIFHDLTVLMDKMGRLPKTFSGRKVNLPSPDSAQPFLQLAMRLLDTVATSAMSCEVEPPPFIRYDDIWPTCEGATPMIEVALRQRLVNIDLVLLHHQLAQSLHLIASLEIKGVHCLSLFDQRVGRFAFFKDLHSYPPLPAHDKDPVVDTNQLHLLKQVIVKAVELMEQQGNAALDFVNQAMKLGYEWNVDVDELRIKYVELLYANGKDHLANEVLPSIGSGAKLAPVLLASTGKRLRSLLKPADTSVLSPLTTEWLAGFSSQEDLFEPVGDTSTDQIIQLLVEALRRFPDDCSDQIIAGELHALLISRQIAK